MSASTNRSAASIAANVATVLFAIVIILQLLLAAILALFAYIIRRRAGLIGDAAPSRAIKIMSWVITAFIVLNTLGNLTSQSTAEKIVFTPITLLLAICCFVVSISKQESAV